MMPPKVPEPEPQAFGEQTKQRFSAKKWQAEQAAKAEAAKNTK